MGAMEGEIKTFRDSLMNRTDCPWKGGIFHEGSLSGLETVVTQCGVGKVQAAMAVQKVIDTYQPRALFFWGIGGSLKDDLVPGDIVAGRETVQHDMDATFFGLDRGKIPGTQFRFVESDRILYNLALSAPTLQGKITGGKILTGDQFISSRNSEQLKYLRDELDGDCVDMEGAAAAFVCHRNGIPHLILRTISDNSDGKQKINLREFLKQSSKNSLHILIQILTGL